MKSASIERTLFFFKDGDQNLIELIKGFFPYYNLLNRLLSEKYKGKKIKFINIAFYTEATYALYPNQPKHYTHYHGGNLWFNGVFDIEAFVKMNDEEQIIYIWTEACNNLREAAILSKNEELLHACNFAFKKGLELKLNPDFILLECETRLGSDIVKAELWIHFFEGNMKSKLSFSKNGIIQFEREIDKTKYGIEFFLDMYKKIEIKNNSIVISGHREVEYLPLVIPINIGNSHM